MICLDISIMRPKDIYHCTTPKMARKYRQTGHIIAPVRGFDSLMAAMAWCIKTGRTVIYRVKAPVQDRIHKLPDHHNKFGEAWWIEDNVSDFKCVFSAESDS